MILCVNSFCVIRQHPPQSRGPCCRWCPEILRQMKENNKSVPPTSRRSHFFFVCYIQSYYERVFILFRESACQYLNTFIGTSEHFVLKIIPFVVVNCALY